MTAPSLDVSAAALEVDRRRLLAMLTERSYARKKIVLSSGRESDFYIDCKKTVLTAVGHWLVGTLMFAGVRSRFPSAIAIGGLTMGADPLASAVSLLSFLGQSPLQAFLVRKEPKGHGTGQWIELTLGNAAIAAASYKFADQADLLVNARLAADAVGATKMDRPEWSAVDPKTGEIYYTLTNNSSRKLEPTGSQQGLDAANPRSYTDAPTASSAPGNVNGHIVRLKENGSESAATAFTWDIYLFGAEAGADAAKVNLSSLTADNDMSSPDGLWFSPKTGLAFIQTDDGAYTDVTNCMMLIGMPGTVGDGTTPTLSYTKADGSTVTVQTRVGAKPTAATLRRFLVGPNDCEITGITETPDGKTIFVNIQHPGEAISKANLADPAKYLSHWPGNAGYGAGGKTARPRSATIVVTRNDGGLIGVDGTAVLNSY